MIYHTFLPHDVDHTAGNHFADGADITYYELTPASASALLHRAPPLRLDTIHSDGIATGSL